VPATQCSHKGHLILWSILKNSFITFLGFFTRSLTGKVQCKLSRECGQCFAALPSWQMEGWSPRQKCPCGVRSWRLVGDPGRCCAKERPQGSGRKGQGMLVPGRVSTSSREEEGWRKDGWTRSQNNRGPSHMAAWWTLQRPDFLPSKRTPGSVYRHKEDSSQTHGLCLFFGTWLGSHAWSSLLWKAFSLRARFAFSLQPSISPASGSIYHSVDAQEIFVEWLIVYFLITGYWVFKKI
jgi:hypothetical protein